MDVHDLGVVMSRYTDASDEQYADRGDDRPGLDDLEPTVELLDDLLDDDDDVLEGDNDVRDDEPSPLPPRRTLTQADCDAFFASRRRE